jgi:hypothetical protein
VVVNRDVGDHLLERRVAGLLINPLYTLG